MSEIDELVSRLNRLFKCRTDTAFYLRIAPGVVSLWRQKVRPGTTGNMIGWLPLPEFHIALGAFYDGAAERAGAPR